MDQLHLRLCTQRKINGHGVVQHLRLNQLARLKGLASRDLERRPGPDVIFAVGEGRECAEEPHVLRIIILRGAQPDEEVVYAAKRQRSSHI